MLQRIQSVYLLIVIIGSALLFFLPITAYFTANFTYTLNVLGLKLHTGTDQLVEVMTWPLLVSNSLVIVFSIFALLKYKNRILQNKIVAFVFLFNAIFLGLAYWITDSLAVVLGTTVHYKAAAVFPILSVLLLVFTAKAIKKDDAKMRAANRLR
jgi:Domain of unknown function (DUF4293)